MDIKPEKVKESTFWRSIKGLGQKLRAFETGNFDLIGSLCQDISSIDEFCGRSSRKMKFANEAAINSYRVNVYSKMTALVLHDGSQAFRYTRKDLIKFLRGEHVHGDSDNRDKKRVALHDFVFEVRPVVSLEYAVTWGFIIFPGLRSSAGNTDSGVPFLQSINIDGRSIEVTQIESIVFSAALECWQVMNGQTVLFNKLAITNDLDAFSDFLGAEIVGRLKDEWQTIKKWQHTKSISLSIR